MSDEEKARFEMRLKLARNVGMARASEQNRIGDEIEMLLFKAETKEACEVLLALAHKVFL